MPTATLDVVRLRLALTRLSRSLRAGDAGFGLTPTQESLVSTLSRTGVIGLSELARREGIHVTQLSRSLGHLESRGLVRRRVDVSDRRAASAELTPAGAKLLAKLRNARTDALRAQLDDLDAWQVRKLGDALPVLELLVERLNEQ